MALLLPIPARRAGVRGPKVSRAPPRTAATRAATAGPRATISAAPQLPIPGRREVFAQEALRRARAAASAVETGSRQTRSARPRAESFIAGAAEEPRGPLLHESLPGVAVLAVQSSVQGRRRGASTRGRGSGSEEPRSADEDGGAESSISESNSSCSSSWRPLGRGTATAASSSAKPPRGTATAASSSAKPPHGAVCAGAASPATVASDLTVPGSRGSDAELDGPGVFGLATPASGATVSSQDRSWSDEDLVGLGRFAGRGWQAWAAVSEISVKACLFTGSDDDASC